MSALDDAIAALGVPAELAEDAKRDGTILALLAEHYLLPGERRHSLADVAREVGLEVDVVQRLWRALGLPQRPASDDVFTDGDVETMRLFVNATVRDDWSYILHESRVISGALARVAEVMVDEMWDAHQIGTSERGVDELAATGVDMARVERLLLHLLRRQIVASLYRRTTLHNQSAGPVQAVGFADLVGYTAMSQRMASADLARLVVTFEAWSHDLVADAGGRVVKTIGDEVMFSCPDPVAAADLARTLARGGPDDLPPMRVAVAWGPVLVREGDCFGPTVNLAARLVGSARPGEALVSDDLRDVLRGLEVEMRPAGEADLEDFGRVFLWRLLQPS